MALKLPLATLLAASLFFAAQAKDTERLSVAPPEKGQISTVAQLRELFASTSSATRNFVLTGVVTYAAQTKSCIVIHDATGPVQLYPTQHALTVGDVVIVSGRAHVPRAEILPWTSLKSIQVIAHQQIDTPPVALALSDFENPAFELRYVKTEATVVDVVKDDLDPQNDFILLKDNETILPAFLPHASETRKLIDARVEIAGLLQRGISSERKFIGTCLSVTSPDSIRTLTPPPADPFDFPPLPSFYITPQSVSRLEKRTARGVVAATWGKHQLLLRADNSGLIVVSLANGETLPLWGERVTAVGYPTTDLLRINLKQAKVRVDKHGNHDHDTPHRQGDGQIPLLETEDGLFFGVRLFGQLVTVRGIVRALPIPQKGDYLLLLDCGNAKLPVDVSSTPSATDGIQVNSTVEITGRYLFQTTEWRPTDILPLVTGLTLVIRTPNDIRIISRPSWWTPGRLIVVIAILFAALVGMHVHGQLRKRYNKIKLKERTQLAVELHDSLSQTLTGLACQISAARRDGDLVSSKAKLTTADQMLQSCRTELKNCLFDLRNDTLSEKTFEAAIRRTLVPFEEQVEISVRFKVRRNLFDDATVHAVLAIVRELVSNAVRHGHAWTVKIAGIHEDGQLLFSVKDDGCGFDPATRKASDDGHFGLDGILERLENLNGMIELTSSPDGGGTKVVVRIQTTAR